MNVSQITFAERFNGVTGSAIREIFKLLAKPGMISFAGGNPSESALPDVEMAQIAADVLRSDGKRILQYGATEGYPPFLEIMKDYVSAHFGVDMTQNGVLPTTGSTQGMQLLLSALINPGDTILVENPTFLGNMQSMRLFRAKLVPVRNDDQGMDTDDLEEKIRKYQPKMVYTIPTFQNPTGCTMGLERRKKIAVLAEQYGVIVAEDDPYHDLRYTGSELPTIKSFDRAGWVVFLGSFSKVISPGLRVGFMAAEPGILRKCVIAKQASDLHTGLLNQALCAEYIRRDLLDSHIRSILPGYARQMNTMLDELGRMSTIASYTRPEGGLFIFASLKEGIDATALLNKAVERGVAYVPGTHFYPDGGHENTFRLNFSKSSPEEIIRGMSMLEETFAEA